ncbi:MAG TPA: hypothetical protein VF757_00215, partial [Sphingomicrobium sp.]
MKARLLAFGALILAAPVYAQPSPADPLAPLPSQPASPPPTPVVVTPPAQLIQAPAPAAPQPAPPTSTIAAPKDWRGVFDALDSGNWAAARAGIAALPPSVLTPVAKAELYTAKDSPTVDLASLQALLAEAPELPQANQLALMAIKRGATTPPLIVPERST